MFAPDPVPVLDEIRSAIEVTALNPPASAELIDDVERRLDVTLPEWLRRVYRSCNGFCGPTGVSYLYPLDGREGVLEFTLFLCEEWPLSWLKRAIVFSDNGVGGSITTHWAALAGRLIAWCYGDGAEFTVVDFDLFELWRREQRRWDAVRAE